MPSRIGDALYWYATYTPNKIAIVSSAGAQTYAQLWSRVCRLSSALADLGVGPGDRIALLMQNSSRYIEVYQAAALMGVAVVPVNFRFVASEIEYVVNHSGAQALIFDASFVDTSSCCERSYPPSPTAISLPTDRRLLRAIPTKHWSYQDRKRRLPCRPISRLATSKAIRQVRPGFQRDASIRIESSPTAYDGSRQSTA
jgi:acyl-CoA synthetase (AMP-forming)/AMP-acid ligase II